MKLNDLFERDFEPVEEYPEMLCGKYPLRIYRSRLSPDNGKLPVKEYRFHFGFPEKLVKPIALLLETDVYWGNTHWKEEGGFWIYWLSVIGSADEKPPYKELQKKLDYMLEAYNAVLRFVQKSKNK